MILLIKLCFRVGKPQEYCAKSIAITETKILILLVDNTLISHDPDDLTLHGGISINSL